MKEQIATTAAPAAIGPYSQAVRDGRFIFCSGQLGLEPASGELAQGVEQQAEQALSNLRAVLGTAGATMDDVVKTTIFLADMADFAAVNAIYARHFGEPFPARSTVAVAALPRGGRVEIEATALVPEQA